MTMKYKNEWGSAGKGYDPQRPDLFKFQVALPALFANGAGGTSLWDSEVAFAVERFPFPERAQQTFDMKHFNQVNHILGADQPMNAIEIPIRYAFSRPTAQIIYRWHTLASNPKTGSTARTSQIKTNGMFYWLIPKQLTADAIDAETDPNALVKGMTYRIEGCMPIGLMPTTANLNEGNQPVTLTFRLSIDRYYPISLDEKNTIFE